MKVIIKCFPSQNISYSWKTNAGENGRVQSSVRPRLPRSIGCCCDESRGGVSSGRETQSHAHSWAPSEGLLALHRECVHTHFIVLSQSQSHSWFKTGQDQFIKNFRFILPSSWHCIVCSLSQVVNVCVSVQIHVVLRRMSRISPAPWTNLSGISVVFSALCKIIFIPSIDMIHIYTVKSGNWLIQSDMIC